MARGAFAEAEPLRRRDLEATERQLGPEHHETLTAMNNLAFVVEAGEVQRGAADVLCCSHRGGWMVLHFLLGKVEKNCRETINHIFRSSQNFVIYVEVR